MRAVKGSKCFKLRPSMVQICRGLNRNWEEKIPWAHGNSPTILGIKMDADRCEN